MTETEAIKLPTAVLRENVEGFVGRCNTFLLLHYKYFMLIACIIVFLILFFKMKNRLLARRAKRYEFKSTNQWFSWEDFEEWKREQREK